MVDAFFIFLPHVIVQNAWTLFRLSRIQQDNSLDLFEICKDIVDVYIAKKNTRQRLTTFSPNNVTFDKGRPKRNRFNEENWYGDVLHVQSNRDVQNVGKKLLRNV